MSFLLLAAACVLIRPLWAFLLSILYPEAKKKDNHESTVGENVAELNGGSWVRLSVFEHIELGLQKNPDGPAVICTFQPTDHLDDVIYGLEERAERLDTLWKSKQQAGEKKAQNGVEQTGLGILDHSATGHRNFGLWSRHPSGIGSPPPSPVSSREESTLQTALLNPTCLTLSYTQLHRTALKLASGIIANGGQENTRMLMLIPNGGEYTLLLWACVLLRITYVSMDPSSLEIAGFTTLKHMLRSIKPQLVVAPDSISGRALDVAFSELGLPTPIRLCLSTPSRSHGWKSLAEIASKGATHPVDEAALVAAARADAPNRIHSIMFTSGTSGLPKGCPMRVGGMSHVLHSQAWLVDETAGAVALQQPHNSRGIAPAQTLQTWRAGGAVVMTGQQFSVRDAVDAIRRFGVTFLVLTPPMVHEFEAELTARPLDVGSVRKIQVGGDAVTKGVLVRCAALFPLAEVCVNHGMTEGGGSFQWPFFEMPTSSIPFFGEICPIGAVAPGSTVRIWDAEKKRVADKGALGELHIRSSSLINHYLGGRSEDSFYNDSKGRWFNTGDIAMANKDGLVFILGRRKDMIKKAGVGIMPAAIESSVEAYTGAHTIVVSAPHHVLGSEPFAVLSSYNGKTEAQIKDHVRSVFGKDYALGGLASLEKLGMAEFPLNATHKIIKSEVQSAVAQHIKVETQ